MSKGTNCLGRLVGCYEAMIATLGLHMVPSHHLVDYLTIPTLLSSPLEMQAHYSCTILAGFGHGGMGKFLLDVPPTITKNHEKCMHGSSGYQYYNLLGFHSRPAVWFQLSFVCTPILQMSPPAPI